MFNSDFDTEMPQGGGRHRRAELRAALRAAAADAGPRGLTAPLAIMTPACRGTNLADRFAFLIFFLDSATRLPESLLSTLRRRRVVLLSSVGGEEPSLSI